MRLSPCCKRVHFACLCNQMLPECNLGKNSPNKLGTRSKYSLHRPDYGTWNCTGESGIPDWKSSTWTGDPKSPGADLSTVYIVPDYLFGCLIWLQYVVPDLSACWVTFVKSTLELPKLSTAFSVILQHNSLCHPVYHRLNIIVGPKMWQILLINDQFGSSSTS